MLSHPVQTGLLAFTFPVALKNSGLHWLHQPPELVTDVGLNFGVRVCNRVTDRQLPASTTFLILQLQIRKKCPSFDLYGVYFNTT